MPAEAAIFNPGFSGGGSPMGGVTITPTSPAPSIPTLPYNPYQGTGVQDPALITPEGETITPTPGYYLPSYLTGDNITDGGNIFPDSAFPNYSPPDSGLFNLGFSDFDGNGIIDTVTETYLGGNSIVENTWKYDAGFDVGNYDGGISNLTNGSWEGGVNDVVIDVDPSTAGAWVLAEQNIIDNPIDVRMDADGLIFNLDVDGNGQIQEGLRVADFGEEGLIPFSESFSFEYDADGRQILVRSKNTTPAVEPTDDGIGSVVAGARTLIDSTITDQDVILDFVRDILGVNDITVEGLDDLGDGVRGYESDSRNYHTIDYQDGIITLGDYELNRDAEKSAEVDKVFELQGVTRYEYSPGESGFDATGEEVSDFFLTEKADPEDASTVEVFSDGHVEQEFNLVDEKLGGKYYSNYEKYSYDYIEGEYTIEESFDEGREGSVFAMKDDNAGLLIRDNDYSYDYVDGGVIREDGNTWHLYEVSVEDLINKSFSEMEPTSVVNLTNDALGTIMDALGKETLAAATLLLSDQVLIGQDVITIYDRDIGEESAVAEAEFTLDSNNDVIEYKYIKDGNLVLGQKSDDGVNKEVVLDLSKMESVLDKYGIAGMFASVDKVDLVFDAENETVTVPITVTVGDEERQGYQELVLNLNSDGMRLGLFSEEVNEEVRLTQAGIAFNNLNEQIGIVDADPINWNGPDGFYEQWNNKGVIEGLLAQKGLGLLDGLEYDPELQLHNIRITDRNDVTEYIYIDNDGNIVFEEMIAAMMLDKIGVLLRYDWDGKDATVTGKLIGITGITELTEVTEEQRYAYIYGVIGEVKDGSSVVLNDNGFKVDLTFEGNDKSYFPEHNYLIYNTIYEKQGDEITEITTKEWDNGEKEVITSSDCDENGVFHKIELVSDKELTDPNWEWRHEEWTKVYDGESWKYAPDSIRIVEFTKDSDSLKLTFEINEDGKAVKRIIDENIGGVIAYCEETVVGDGDFFTSEEGLVINIVGERVDPTSDTGKTDVSGESVEVGRNDNGFSDEGVAFLQEQGINVSTGVPYYLYTYEDGTRRVCAVIAVQVGVLRDGEGNPVKGKDGSFIPVYERFAGGLFVTIKQNPRGSRPGTTGSSGVSGGYDGRREGPDGSPMSNWTQDAKATAEKLGSNAESLKREFSKMTPQGRTELLEGYGALTSDQVERFMGITEKDATLSKARELYLKAMGVRGDLASKLANMSDEEARAFLKALGFSDEEIEAFLALDADYAKTVFLKEHGFSDEEIETFLSLSEEEQRAYLEEKGWTEGEIEKLMNMTREDAINYFLENSDKFNLTEEQQALFDELFAEDSSATRTEKKAFLMGLGLTKEQSDMLLGMSEDEVRAYLGNVRLTDGQIQEYLELDQDARREFLEGLGIKDEDIEAVLAMEDQDEIRTFLGNVSRETGLAQDKIDGYLVLVTEGASLEVKTAYLEGLGLSDDNIQSILDLTDINEVTDALSGMSQFSQEQIDELFSIPSIYREAYIMGIGLSEEDADSVLNADVNDEKISYLMREAGLPSWLAEYIVDPKDSQAGDNMDKVIELIEVATEALGLNRLLPKAVAEKAEQEGSVAIPEGNWSRDASGTIIGEFQEGELPTKQEAVTSDNTEAVTYDTTEAEEMLEAIADAIWEAILTGVTTQDGTKIYLSPDSPKEHAERFVQAVLDNAGYEIPEKSADQESDTTPATEQPEITVPDLPDGVELPPGMEWPPPGVDVE